MKNFEEIVKEVKPCVLIGISFENMYLEDFDQWTSVMLKLKLIYLSKRCDIIPTLRGIDYRIF